MAKKKPKPKQTKAPKPNGKKPSMKAGTKKKPAKKKAAKKAPQIKGADIDIYNRGVELFENGQNDKAMRYFQRAVELDFYTAAALNYIGIILSQQQKWSEAIAVLMRAQSSDPEFESYNNLAWLYATCPDAAFRNGKRAVELATAAVEHRPEASYIGTLAAAHAEAGDFAQAVRLQLKLVKDATTRQQKQEYTAPLALYELKRPFRESVWQPVTGHHSVTKINLGPYRVPLAKFLKDTVSNFRKEHAKAVVSAMGVYCPAYGRYLFVSFDTAEHSAGQVKQYEAQGPDWYGKDAKGRYCNNPADFAYAEYAAFNFEDFPDLYEAGSELAVTMPDGKVLKVDMEEEGNEGINQVLFKFLMKIVKDSDAYVRLNREPVFRIGVVMHDSEYRQFWNPAKK